MFKSIANAVLSSLPLGVFQKVIRRRVIGINYHVVSDSPLHHIRHLYPYKTVDQFEKDLIYLKMNHNLVSYDQLISEHEVKDNSVIITFDDGYKELYSIIRPLLLKHDVPAIFFVITDLLDNKHLFMRNGVSLCVNKLLNLERNTLTEITSKVERQAGVTFNGRDALIAWVMALSSSDESTMEFLYGILEIDCERFLNQTQPYLTREQIQELVADGFTIGGHSLNHPNFLELSNNDAIERQIVESCNIVRSMTNAETVPFAFPYTSEGIDRKFIAKVIDRHKFIPYMFGESSLTKPEPFFIYRAKGDSLAANNSDASNLNQLFKLEYISYIKSRTRAIFIN